MMVVLWIIIIVMLCLLISASSALIALHFQYHTLEKVHQEREAWQQAQEARQRIWEVRQGKHILEAEKKLADQLKDVRREWREWSLQVEQSQQDWQDRAMIEQELARLPHVDHLELSPNTPGQHQQPEHWRPSTFYGADLRGRDLSHRYLQRADLRDTQLAKVNLYMADLSGASLTGADLSGANLIGANLSGADLRDANLSGANFLVTDLHNAILHRAVLLGARNLSPQQLQAAIYDSTTLIDSAITSSQPLISGAASTPAQSPEAVAPIAEENTGQDDLPAIDGAAASLPPPGEPLTNETPAPSSARGSGQENNALAPPRKGTRKAPQTAPPPETPEQTPSATLEETPGGSREIDRQEEEAVESYELPSNKIIQLQAHVTKTAFSSSSQKQHNAKKRSGKSRTSRTGSTGSKSKAPRDQETRAN